MTPRGVLHYHGLTAPLPISLLGRVSPIFLVTNVPLLPLSWMACCRQVWGCVLRSRRGGLSPPDASVSPWTVPVPWPELASVPAGFPVVLQASGGQSRGHVRWARWGPPLGRSGRVRGKPGWAAVGPVAKASSSGRRASALREEVGEGAGGEWGAFHPHLTSGPAWSPGCPQAVRPGMGGPRRTPGRRSPGPGAWFPV